jgi:4,5-dihydroxyphthalate decarboxylase
MSKLPITLACGAYDRTEALATGAVEVEGVDLRYVALEPEEIFFRMARHREFDVAELSLSTYLVTLCTDSPFVALPVFPSRMFRHSGIYVNSSAGIRSPAQLEGARVGLAEYQLTANVWIRGILADHHDVPVASPEYLTGGLNQPGRIEKVAVRLPPDVRVSPIDAGSTLSSMLAQGELDAVYSPRAPESFLSGDGRVRRLFEEPQEVEAEYYRRTGIFPIMHVLVIRRPLYEANPWLARSLTKAFAQAKVLAHRRLEMTAALSVTLPWLHEEIRRTAAVMGGDFWPYGLTANREALRVFARYSHGQGLSDRLLSPEELFAPEAIDEILI